MEDLKIFEFILERITIEPGYEDLVNIQATLAGTGIVVTYGHCTPVMDLIMFLMGLENFIYFLQDYPDEINTVLEMMQTVRKKEYQILADSPADIVTTYENTGTTLLSQTLMVRYEFPALAEYSEIIHSAGKTPFGTYVWENWRQIGPDLELSD